MTFLPLVRPTAPDRPFGLRYVRLRLGSNKVGLQSSSLDIALAFALADILSIALADRYLELG